MDPIRPGARHPVGNSSSTDTTSPVAIGRPWPIEPAHVPIIMDGFASSHAHVVDPAKARGHTATYELRLRGLARYVYAFSGRPPYG